MADLPVDQQDEIARVAAEVMEGSTGLPIGVAVMTLAYQDEKCLRVMKEIERRIGFAEHPVAYKNAVAVESP